MRPASASDSEVTSVPAGRLARSASDTIWCSTRNGLVKPRFGMRRVSGIWPPSNCGLPPPGPWCPERALIPLCPLPDVFPVPDPGPRPRRFRLRCEPGAGARLCRPSFPPGRARVSLFSTGLLLDRRHLDQVPHVLDLTAERGRVLLDHLVLMVAQPERLERGL